MLKAKRRERTLAQSATVRGHGFFHGADVSLSFQPAGEGTGVVFKRVDLPGHPTVPARIDHVVPAARRTSIRNGDALVEMTEHVLAALSGLQIDNCVIQIDAPECPGCDGSSRVFVEALEHAGIMEQNRLRPVLELDSSVVVRDGAAMLAANPGAAGALTLAYHLDYGPAAPIHAHSYCLGLTPQTFKKELASSRTFVTESEAGALRAAGIGLRATPADVLIFGCQGPIGNSLRFPDECARHKVLDLLGDLALLGFDLEGMVVAHRSGHQNNHALARRIMDLAKGRRARSTAQVEHLPAGCALDIHGVMSFLPHRYPFLLVDRVLELEPCSRALAIKNVSINEPFFTGHWPGLPIMPGVLILESVAQAAGLLIAASIDSPDTKFALIASIDQVKLRRPVVPGDQLRLEVRAERLKNRAACIRGRACVGESLAAEAQFRFVIQTADRAAGSIDGINCSCQGRFRRAGA